MARPNHAYYRACHGRWRCPIQLQITDRAALGTSGMSWIVRMAYVLMAAWPSWLGRYMFETTVTYAEGEDVVHTTAVKWLGIPIMWGTERITLDEDGRAFTIRGEHRLLTAIWLKLEMSGSGTIDEAAEHAEYEMTWLGAPMRQTTVREPDRVTVTQEGAGWKGVQPLARVV